MTIDEGSGDGANDGASYETHETAQSRPKLRQRALSLFKRNKSHQAAASSIPASNHAPIAPETLPYQPRLKSQQQQQQQQQQQSQPFPSTSSPPPQSTPRDPIHDRLQAAMPAQPSTGATDSPSQTTPTQAGRASFASNSSSPSTPRPQIATSTSQPLAPSSSSPATRSTSTTQHHHHPHLHRLRLPYPSRKSGASIDKSLAKGRSGALSSAASASSAVAIPYVPGAFPVAPSYHEKAHPALQPPKQAFNLLDGPASRADAATTTQAKASNSTLTLGDPQQQSQSPSPASSPGLQPPVAITGDTLPPPRLQRPAIKVKIITWNMGGASLPKGDLEVLLGRVGGYVPPEADWDADVESDSEGDDDGEIDSDDDDEDDHAGSTRPHWQVSSFDDDELANTRDSSEGTPTAQRSRKRSRTRPAVKTKGKGVPGQENVPRHDRIPPLPYDDGHPYHLLVVAGQECPWGDGKRIATGLGVAGELSDLARTKTRAHGKPAKEFKEQEKGKEKEGVSAAAASFPASTSSSYDSRPTSGMISTSSAIAQTPSGLGGFEGGQQEFPFGSPPSSTPIDITSTDKKLPGSTPPTVHSKGFGGKGWSDMCEDWLCRGPAAQTQATKGLAATTEAVLQGSVPSQDVSHDHSRASSPEPGASNVPSEMAASPTKAGGQATESMDTPFSSTPLPNALNLATRRSSTTNGNSLTIPMPSFGRSSSSNSLSAAGNRGGQGTPGGSPVPTPLPSPGAAPVAFKDFAMLSSPGSTGGNAPPGKAMPVTSSNIAKEKARQQLHHLQIPGNSQRDGTPQALGAYELIAKERCAMIYMAVYCWRGCRDRVRGVSRSHVKSGMLAGRVGNKGAVGISVKMGQSRLLFVNSHLAAHEGKVQTRLDNIAKIKRELRVDTYLDQKDPRNRLEDVTEMFDHSFWFGDLNFRVDITRQHADWLVMQKRYDQALEFDQLRKVIKEGREFKGFREHEIAFPPTYKYDVLKTLKKPKRERTVRRILHRRGHSATDVVTSPSALSDEPDAAESGNMMTMESPVVGATTVSAAPETVPELDDETEEGDDDSDSVSSSAWDSFGSSGFATNSDAHGRHGTDSEDESSGNADDSLVSSPIDAVVSSNTSAAQGPMIFSHGAAIKAKWKIMDLVRSATGSSAGSSSHDHHGAKDRKSTQSASKRHSQSSAGGTVSPTSSSNMSPSPSSSSYSARPLPTGKRTNSGSSGRRGGPEDAHDEDVTVDDAARSRSGRDRERIIRHEPSLSSIDSVLLGDDVDSARVSRHTRNHSSPGEGTSASISSHKTGSIEPGLTRTVSSATAESEYEAQQQRYDTSAKQRVPSWTDRILWRSNVVIVNKDADGPGEGLGTKVGKSFTNAMRAAGASVRSRDFTSGHHQREQQQQRESRRSRQRRPDSRESASSGADGAQTTPRGMPPRAKTFSHPPSTSDSPLALETHPSDPYHHKFRLLHGHHIHRSRGSRSPHKGDAGAIGGAADTSEPSSLLDGVPSNADALLDDPLPLTHGEDRDRKASTPPRMPPRRTASVSTTPTSPGSKPGSLLHRDRSSPTLSALRVVSQPSATKTRDDGVNRHHARGESHARTQSRPMTNGGGGAAAVPPPPQGSGFLSSWWSSHVPNILTTQGAVAALNSLTNRDIALGGGDSSPAPLRPAPPPPPPPTLVGPRKGQVECLLYKSLDDREMRALEGRSDHRPVIWVGSIGI